MKSTNSEMAPGLRMPIAGLLGWLLPGAGHLFIGEVRRGVVIMLVIAATFWTGIAIGGLKNTVNPVDRSWWFLGQICTGGHALATLAVSKRLPDGPQLVAFGRSEEVSVVYTGIAGMLNLLVILDVLVRAEKGRAEPVGRADSAARRAAS
jgi:hypothetical protein